VRSSARQKRIPEVTSRPGFNGAQAGYVLITTLAGMLLCVTIVSSLLAVTLSTMSIEESGRTREQQNRAAEGAVEVAINQIRNNGSIAAADVPLPKQCSRSLVVPTPTTTPTSPIISGLRPNQSVQNPLLIAEPWGTISILGAKLTGATSVNFGSRAATSFAIVSDTEITAVVPAPAALTTGSVVNVSVSTPAGGVSAPIATAQFNYCDPNYDLSLKPDEQLPRVPTDEGYDAKYDPALDTKMVNAPCEPVNNLVNIDGFRVRIKCYNGGLTQYPPLGGDPVEGVPADDGGTALRLVGDRSYQGDPNSALDQLPTVDEAKSWRQFPFGDAMTQGFNLGELNASTTKGQLVYAGAAPLRTVGSVEVQNQIVALTDAGPAMKVDGTVRQGGPGLFASATGTTGCGIAEPNDNAGASQADIFANLTLIGSANAVLCSAPAASFSGTGGLAPARRVLPCTSVTNPPCAEVAANGDWDNARVQSAQYQDWDQSGTIRAGADILKYDGLAYDCDSFRVGGASSKVISIPPGSYGPQATKVLNQWFTSTCPGRTFYFPPGDYWFDVDDPSLPETDPRKHSLVFGEYQNSWVFGLQNFDASSGKRPMNADFPGKACLRSAPSTGRSGASITLSARTGLQHTAGRVVVCGPIWAGATHDTAIFQRPALPLGSLLLPDAWSSATFSPEPPNNVQCPSSDLLRKVDSCGLKVKVDNVSQTCWVSGTCGIEKAFQVSGLGKRAADGFEPGPATLPASVFVDLTAAANGTSGQTATRFDITLSNNDSCYMIYLPNSKKSMATAVTSTVSYDIRSDPDNTGAATDGIDGNCDFVLTDSMSQQLLKDAKIAVTVTLNPPQQGLNSFGQGSFWDSVNQLGWDTARGVVNAARYLTGRSTFTDREFKTNNCPPGRDRFGLLYCPRFSAVGPTYTVDTVDLRLNWMPKIDIPAAAAQNNFGTQVNFVNPQNGGRDTSAATTVTSSTAATARLTYNLSDPNLRDGFLPVTALSVGAKMSITTPNAGDTVQFDLLTNATVSCNPAPDAVVAGQTCRGATSTLVESAASSDDKVRCTVSKPLNDFVGPGNANLERTADFFANGALKCQVGKTGPSVPSVEVGQLVSHADLVDKADSTPPQGAVAAQLEVLVSLANTGSNRTLSLDYATVSAKADGYQRPLDPFTVKWNPLTENKSYSLPGFPSARSTDATFNVFGPVSVPNNDVRVIWNWDNGVAADDNDKPKAAGPTGFAIFNGGSVSADKCGAGVSEFCKPGLVASALGSWTTGTWPTNPTDAQKPDPLASSGATRFPFRTARLVACVLDEKGNSDPADDELLPRLDAKVQISDRQGNLVSPGSTVSVIDWKILKNSTFKYGASVVDTPCNIYS
jgi:hypothetical protein